MKGKIHYELILLFKAGLKPRQLISMGYPVSTAYHYSAAFKKIDRTAADILALMDKKDAVKEYVRKLL